MRVGHSQANHKLKCGIVYIVSMTAGRPHT